uniref:G-protein coupled receptors family 1 profile domain-containing protein n=1 Tax=Strigamia maritima TaxID=126957 RepID=T1J538_STRMM
MFLKMSVTGNMSRGSSLTERLLNTLNLSDAEMEPTGFESKMLESELYCGDEFVEFHTGFKVFHGYFSIIVCLFGIITNILNIIVLTRKDMISPTNAILTGLAVADMLVMLDYLPFSVHTYILIKYETHEEHFAYHWTLLILFHAHFSVVCHTISIGLTITLAVWRYIAVSLPNKNREWCNMERARIAIVSSYLFPLVFCIPVYLTFSIHSQLKTDPIAGHLYEIFVIDISDVALAHHGLLRTINFWVYSVIVKLVPCVALTLLSLSLIVALYRANERKIKLVNRANSESDQRACDRTTRMLLAVLLLFLITEFPQGIFALLSGVLGDAFFRTCYQNFGEMMDILALINSAINFILYCTMSRQFRQTFNRLFKPRILNNWIAIPQDPHTQATTCV